MNEPPLWKLVLMALWADPWFRGFVIVVLFILIAIYLFNAWFDHQFEREMAKVGTESDDRIDLLP
jgi:hypothetical protein